MKNLLILLFAINIYAVDMDLTIAQIKYHEGYSSTMYEDNGHFSIGYGTNISSITEIEAEILLVHRLSNRLSTLKKFNWFNNLNSARQQVILDMSYQLGMNRLLKLKHLIWRLKNGYYLAASNAMIGSEWYRKSGKHSKRLAEQMRRGW